MKPALNTAPRPLVLAPRPAPPIDLGIGGSLNARQWRLICCCGRSVIDVYGLLSEVKQLVHFCPDCEGSKS